MPEGGFSSWFKKGEKMGQPPIELKIDESDLQPKPKQKTAEQLEEEMLGADFNKDESSEEIEDQQKAA